MAAHRNDKKVEGMYRLYQKGFSLAQVGRAFGVTRQSVFKSFRRRALALRTVTPVPFVFWRGIKFSRRSGGYYARTTGKRIYLHRAVWTDAHGQIPDGFDVHHLNRDPSDNRIENLQLLSCSDHGRLHAQTNVGFRSCQFKKGHKSPPFQHRNQYTALPRRLRAARRTPISV